MRQVVLIMLRRSVKMRLLSKWEVDISRQFYENKFLDTRGFMHSTNNIFNCYDLNVLCNFFNPTVFYRNMDL